MSTYQDTVMASIQEHAAHPDISLDAHIKSRRIELGQEVNSFKKVYLDKRFWIIARDVANGIELRQDRVYLIEALRERANHGEVICPISETLFIELYKQSDKSSRANTIQLIDELSRGVTLENFFDRVATELNYLFHKCGNREFLWPLHDLVWSKVSYVFGEMHPTETPFDDVTELIIQKAFFDHIWELPLTEIERYIGDTPMPPMNSEKLAESINTARVQHQSDIRSFKSAYVIEVSGALSVFMPVARKILESMSTKATGEISAPSDNEAGEHEFKLEGFFTNLAERGKLAKLLPTLHITSLCHAEYRRDPQRVMTANDFMDFYHAASAVAYCDAFLTEKDLYNLLRKKNMKLSEDFSCRVETNIADSLDCVTTI